MDKSIITFEYAIFDEDSGMCWGSFEICPRCVPIAEKHERISPLRPTKREGKCYMCKSLIEVDLEPPNSFIDKLEHS